MAESTSTDSPSAAAAAAQLKEEGNKLFAAKDYDAAYKKYSEAMEVDNRNAVIFANRGACSFAMKKYADAARDCDAATRLDPNYTKAWVRLGASLKHVGHCELSITAYENALKSLPSNDASLTDAQRGIKRQCLNELKEARKKLSARPNIGVSLPDTKGEAPWKRAWNMRDELMEKGPEHFKSSGWILLKAYEEFKKGMDIIKLVRSVPTADGERIVGSNNGILHVTNGILRDRRVFHVDDAENWDTNWHLQAQLELTRYDAEHLVASGAQYLMAEALKIKAKKGWDVLRPMLSTVVRCWILEGFHESGPTLNPVVAVKYFDSVIEVLEWGRRTWKDVPKAVRGDIFEDTFFVGVKSLRLDACIARYEVAKGTPESAALLEGLRPAAVALANAAANAAEPDMADPGYWLSFYVYPKAQARAVLAAYHVNKIDQAPDESTRQMRYSKAAQGYEQAAEEYAIDDEYYIHHLALAFKFLLLSHAPVRSVLDVLERIEEQLPATMEIWEFSPRRDWMDENLPQIHAVGKKLRDKLAKGELQMESRVSDSMIK